MRDVDPGPSPNVKKIAAARLCLPAQAQVRWSFALHELKRTKEAYERLRPVIDRFPGEWMMRYNLACYACQLGNLKEAWSWLEKASELGDPNVKLLALGDKDLEPFWTRIGQV